mmetsp:Transcript_36438/g.89753  ORF Transcript_36438/g.89753 Transcript_36438/m.89753 type:complete len:305 (+) Transcript_36438:450-1364(+)
MLCMSSDALTISIRRRLIVLGPDGVADSVAARFGTPPFFGFINESRSTSPSSTMSSAFSKPASEKRCGVGCDGRVSERRSEDPAMRFVGLSSSLDREVALPAVRKCFVRVPRSCPRSVDPGLRLSLSRSTCSCPIESHKRSMSRSHCECGASSTMMLETPVLVKLATDVRSVKPARWNDPWYAPNPSRFSHRPTTVLTSCTSPPAADEPTRTPPVSGEVRSLRRILMTACLSGTFEMGTYDARLPSSSTLASAFPHSRVSSNTFMYRYRLPTARSSAAISSSDTFLRSRTPRAESPRSDSCCCR